MIELLRCAFLNLFRKKSRTVLTVLSVAVGVASVLLIATVSKIGTNTIEEELNSLGIGALTVSSTAKNEYPLHLGHLTLLQNQKGVRQAVPILSEKSKVQARQTDFVSMVWGIDSGANQIFHLNLTHGSLFRTGDIENAKQVCLVDESLANTLYSRSNIAGKTLGIYLNGRYYDFLVIGIVSSGGNIAQSIIGDFVPSFVYIPYTTMQTLSGRNRFDQIALQLDTSEDTDAYASLLIETLETAEGKENIFTTQNIAKQKEQLNAILSTVTGILTIVAAISLVVAGMGIMIVMLASVGERTKEIGIKKSIGASRGMIICEFLFEAVILSVVGSAAGFFAGTLFVFIGCGFLHIPFQMDLSAIGYATCFAAANGLLFGVYPSLAAANLKPVDALRHE